MNAQTTILPQDPAEAVGVMTEITKRLLIAMQEEARAIGIKNEVAMQDVEVLKDKLVPMYEMAAAEFRARAAEFKDVAPHLLNDLQDVQTELGNVARDNQFNLA
jgi:hypothetical protein